MITKKLLPAILWTLVLACLTSPLTLAQSANCTVLQVYQPDQLSKGRSLSIQLFPVTGRLNYKPESVENLRIALAEKLYKRLKNSKYFSHVQILPEDRELNTDLLLQGQFRGIDQGNKALRMFLGRGAATMQVQGRLLSNASEPVADFVCASQDLGGVGGTGLFWWMKSGAKKTTRRNAERTAKAIAKLLPKIEKDVKKLQKKQASDTKTPIVARTKPTGHEWRGSSKENWTLEDLSREAATFVAKGPGKKKRRAEALWVTQPAYEALSMLTLRQSVKPKIIRKHRIEGFLPLSQELRELTAEDAYVLAVSFRKKGPMIGSRDETLRHTFLQPMGEPAQQVKPLRLIDADLSSGTLRVARGWISSLTVFIFPDKSKDGTPLVNGLDKRFKLSTKIDGQVIECHFDLRNFSLEKIEQLKFGSPDKGDSETETGTAQ